MPSTGSVVIATGRYTCPECRTTVVLLAGDRAPPCEHCRRPVDWFWRETTFDPGPESAVPKPYGHAHEHDESDPTSERGRHA